MHVVVHLPAPILLSAYACCEPAQISTWPTQSWYCPCRSLTESYQTLCASADVRGRTLKFFDFSAEGEIDDKAIANHVYPIFEVRVFVHVNMHVWTWV